MKAATHDGTFHADDVFAHAVLRAALGDMELVRTRDPARIAAADIVFDVGAVYDPTTRRYDHHMRERPLRSDGTPYSSVGLIWRDFGIAALPGLLGRPALEEDVAAQVWRDVDTDWIVHIDKADNGVSDAGPGHLSALIEAMNPVWDAPTAPDEAFLEASELAYRILARACQHAEAAARAAKVVVDAARGGADPRIIVLDRKLPWDKAIFEGGLSGALFVIYPSEDGSSWYVRTVPPEPASFGQRLPLPEAWRGLNGEAFAGASGVPDATFCHPSRFICGARSQNSAIELARRAIALAEGSRAAF